MDSKILEYMIAIAEEKSISRAADMFYLSQPVMSRHLQKIENELGTKLFFRDKGEMRLTDAGRIYINQARQILYIERKMIQDLGDLKERMRHSVRVMVDPYLMHYFERQVIPAAAAKNMKREPDLVEGAKSRAMDELKAGLVDYAVFRSGAFSDNELKAEEIFRDRLLLCVPREWITPQIEKSIKEYGLSALQGQRVILERSDQVMRSLEQDILMDYVFYPRNPFEVTGTASALLMVKDQQGMAFLPASIAAVAGDVISTFELKHLHEVNVYLVRRKDRVPDAEDRRLCRMIREEYGKWDQYMQRRFGEE